MVNQRYARHIGIVQQLRSKSWVSTTALATRFDVSVRTIYRDIEELNTAGLPIESVAGREGGYRLSAESPVDPLIMDADDPYGRGEDETPTRAPAKPTGAPPRAWGGRRRPGPGCSRRSTPTGVGRTTCSRAWATRSAEHPHGRGEDTVTRPSWSPISGAPPRAWGGPQLLRGHRARVRSTPTGVGRTFGVHAATVMLIGAPPRAWGGLDGMDAPRSVGRSTPTGVGRTPCRRAAWTPWAEHPHGRGEDAFGSADASRTEGAPPRAWGGQPQRRLEDGQPRSTPTGVGRTRSPHRG